MSVKEDHDLVVFNAVIVHRGSVLRISLKMLQIPRSLLEVAFVLEQERDEGKTLREWNRVKSHIVGKPVRVLLAYRECYCFVPCKSQQVAQPEEKQYDRKIALLFLESLLVVEKSETALFFSKLKD